MADPAVKFVSALACEDIREEADGKIMAIGIISPVIGLEASRSSPDAEVMPLKLHFLLVVDFLEQGSIDLRFRLKRTGSFAGTIRRKMGILVAEPQKRVPLPVGPFLFKPRPGDDGFLLQYQVGERWRTIGRWTIDPPIPETETNP